ncbi:hypothetical protein SBRY_40459 [Actinacidiphila bryophytorum]|uniref:Uncharacterized protein n=1 Tax=Actinacidiphila bryophytorum TaxID=1436133 RepID=A0A9W4MH09_9ACTN|nr:hypothetical protein SBRY_40459 [Actinacidiphila bryophytorum]
MPLTPGNRDGTKVKRIDAAPGPLRAVSESSNGRLLLFLLLSGRRTVDTVAANRLSASTPHRGRAAST